jgi:DNA (cytosine-5)-methyltransferase 1
VPGHDVTAASMTKLTAFSMFSGVGGLCEGVRLAGFQVTGACEKDPFAAESYRFNFPGVPLFEGDVAGLFPAASKKTLQEHLDQYVGSDRVDLVFGGPPCQGYSQIGPRDVADPRNELYLEVCRVATLLHPRFILIENVPNMLLMKSGLFKKRILGALRDIGYDNIGLSVLDASLFGVPQKRKRVFILAAKSEEIPVSLQEALDITAASMEQRPVTVKEAIDDLPEHVAPDSGEVLPYPSCSRLTPFQKEMRLDRDGEIYRKAEKSKLPGIKTGISLHNHHTKEIQAERLRLIKLLAPGKKADSLPKEVWDNARPEKWRRFDPDAPAHTLMAQMHRDLSEWVHPYHHRWITVREALRLQSFHDGFVLQTSEWQQLKQVGNAVPPLLGRIPALALKLALNTSEGRASPFPVKRGGVIATLPRLAR